MKRYQSQRENERNYWLALLVAISVLIILIVPFSDRMVSSGDDEQYFAQATSIAYFQFPSFKKEFLQDMYPGQNLPSESVGSGVLASPFVFIGSIVDRILGSSIRNSRTGQNIFWSWSMLGFQISTMFYLLLGASFLYLMLLKWGTPKESAIFTFTTIVGGGGLLVYTAVRPVMSEVYEFFGITGLLYLYFKKWDKSINIKNAVYMSLTLSFVLLTRYNNAVLVGLFYIVLTYQTWYHSEKDRLKTYTALMFPFLMNIFVWRIIPIIVNGINPNDLATATPLRSLIHPIPIQDWLSRLSFILLNPGMGLLFTATPLCLGLLFVSYKNRLDKATNAIYVPLIISMAVNFYIVINWNGFGGYFGYRYFVIPSMPMIAIIVMQIIAKNKRKNIYHKILLGSVFFPFLSVLFWYSDPKFQANVLRHKDGSQFIDVSHSYNIQTLHDFFADPLQILAFHLRNGICQILNSQVSDNLTTSQYMYALIREILYVLMSIGFALWIYIWSKKNEPIQTK